jgi:hypothetical protein
LQIPYGVDYFYEDDNTIRMLLIAQRIKDKSMMCEENDYDKWTIATLSLTGADIIVRCLWSISA